MLRRFPATLNPRLLDRAEQISDVIAVPETMLRGFERQASGPGWALAGDAGLFKHPVTAQGIGDALAQGWYVGTALARGETLEDYAAWRADRAAEHFEWSYDAAHFPSSRAAAIYSGLVADRSASTEFLDTFTKRLRPSEVFTKERKARWRPPGPTSRACTSFRPCSTGSRLRPSQNLSLPVLAGASETWPRTWSAWRRTLPEGTSTPAPWTPGRTPRWHRRGRSGPPATLRDMPTAPATPSFASWNTTGTAR